LAHRALAAANGNDELVAISRGEALQVARKMLRGFPGAPDPRRHAHRLYSELVHAEGWSTREEAAIVALGAWLDERPNHDLLKPRCADLLGRLG
jgi:hypothetical protein